MPIVAGRPRGSYAGTPARRQAILQAALEVFAVSGYRGGSMRDIAERLGMSHTSLLHHFRTKSDLLAGVLELRDQEAEELIGAPSPGADRLRGLVRLVEHNQAVPGIVELFCVLSAEATSPEHPAHGYFRDRYERVVAFVEDSLAVMAAAGELHEGVSPAVEARAIVALTDGLQLQWLLDRDSVDMVTDLRAYLAKVSPLAF
ncbi:TetR/AcrR family transcriptional regulator [Agromyces sp. MMS24-K17]|uniref:TetR/AcrR family transcriptional regulator n=1 Tax=Agromyces sp. MMS24-K17 TaxID=3372850 RepID=UPI003754B998